METITNILNSSEEYYKTLNRFISDGTIMLCNGAYPEHDGVEDSEYISTMFELLDRLSAIRIGINIAISHLSDVISDELSLED